MANLSIKIEGLDKFKAGLKKYPEYSVNEMNKAILRSVGLLQNQTIKEAPVNKVAMGGNLRQSVRSAMLTKLSGEVTVDAKYALFVHEGTAPHTITAKNKKGLANVRTGQFFGKTVQHPGTKPNKFLERAMSLVTPRVNDLFADAINSVFMKIAGK